MSLTYAPRAEEAVFIPDPVYGCTDSLATNYNPLATEEDGSCTYAGAVLGCTDSQATNYDSDATQDDGSCTYAPDLTPNYVDIICSTYTETEVEYIPGVMMRTYEQTCNVNADKPVLISLHPGGGVYTDFTPTKYAKEFASRGYLGITANYGYDGAAGSFTTAKQKTAMANVCALIRHIRANAVDYGIDPDNIFVCGSSAGALTTLAVNAGALALDNGDAFWDNAINSENAGESSVPTATATQSGAIINSMEDFFISGGIPNYFYHGTADTTMPYAQAIQNYEAMIDDSIGSQFTPYIGDGHSIGTHHDEIMLGGSLLLDGVTVDDGIVQKFANLLVP